MISSKLIFKPIITTNEFLKLYEGDISPDFQKILKLDFEVKNKQQSQKISPILQIARPEEAQEITQIFKEGYKGTYPYKQIEDIQEVKKMIIDSNYHWFLFKLDSNETVGCFGAQMEFEKKKGLLYGFAIKKEYHKIIDVFKTYIGCVLYLWETYKNKILVWYGEVRTNDKTPQYVTSLSGLKPIAFLPNKDIFLNQIESEFLHVIYNEKVLYKYRRKEKSKIIRQILNTYLYSNNRFHLGLPKVENPIININSTKLAKLRRKIVIKTEKYKFNNEIITLSIKNSKSYFMFLYNPFIQTMEKTTYKITKLEELLIYIQKVKKLIKKLKIRYFECFVSAYEPRHQKIFFEAGFKPMGYVFSWEYNNKKKVFEDCVAFIYYEGNIDKNIKLIPETSELLKYLNIF